MPSTSDSFNSISLPNSPYKSHVNFDMKKQKDCKFL